MEARSDASPEQQFVFSRRFDAPRALVWKAWSEPERFVRWWGPKGCTIKLGTMEFRPGGVFHYAMQWQGVPDMWGKFVYERIVPEHSIEFISSFSDADGHLTRAPFPGLDHWPLEVFNTVSFTEHEGRTTVDLRAGAVKATAAEHAQFVGLFDSMQQGYGGTFDQLAEYLAADPAQG
jgi:uncharacterized protein YndB with AHSA1/START domain